MMVVPFDSLGWLVSTHAPVRRVHDAPTVIVS